MILELLNPLYPVLTLTASVIYCHLVLGLPVTQDEAICSAPFLCMSVLPMQTAVAVAIAIDPPKLGHIYSWGCSKLQKNG